MGGSFFSPCLCGASNCRASVNGFNGLTREQQIELLPEADESIQERYRESLQQCQTDSLLSKFYRFCQFWHQGCGQSSAFTSVLFSRMLAPCRAVSFFCLFHLLATRLDSVHVFFFFFYFLYI